MKRLRQYPRRPINRGLPPLPPLAMSIDTHEAVCPQCGSVGTLQHVEDTPRFWSISEITEDGVVVLDDGQFADDGDNQRWDCYACGGQWDYASGPEVSYG